MALRDLSQPKSGITGQGLRALSAPIQKKNEDLSSIEGLKQAAEQAGYGDEVSKILDETPKLSFLQRLGKGLGALNPAEAILTGTEKGVGEGVKKYVTGAAKGVASAITGTDYEGERRTFSDVAEKLGVENGIAKFGLGFLGDVLLDPSTYFGGAIARGIGGVGKFAGNKALQGIGKVAPETEQGLRIAGEGLKDALGRAFQYGYKASKGAKEDVLTFLSSKQKAQLDLAADNLNRLGPGILNQDQAQELALKMIAGKRAEFIAREAGKLGDNLADNITQEARKYKSAEEFVKAQPKANLQIINKEGSTAEIDRIDSLIKKGGTNSIGNYFEKNPEIKTLVGSAEPQSYGFWKKIGAKLDDPSAIGTAEELSGFKLNKSDFLKQSKYQTKSQLIDIWNKANGSKTAAQIAREAARSSDPLVQKTIEAQIARSKKFVEGIVENPYETYFPFIKKDKVQKFLNETQGIRVGSEGYLKQFKNLLSNENIELNPAKAFFTRENQIVSNKMTRDFLNDFVTKYGKPLTEFSNSDDALKAGYQLIKDKGILGTDLGYVPKFDAALIKDAISPEFQTISMLAKATGFDAVTSLFKRAVTGLFAPFHVRNFVSGQIQNFEVLGMDALNPKNINIGQKIAYLMGKGDDIPDGVLNLGGKEMSLKEVMKPFIERFSGDTFYNADFDVALKSGGELKQAMGILTKERAVETAKTLGLGQEGIPFKVGRAIGQFIEHGQKATAYVTALGQGKTIPEALSLAERAGFDYRALTRFESQIMRRLVPFYSFTRKNIELQLRTLGENPQRINQVLRFFGNISEPISAEEKSALPDFIKESLGIKLKDTPEGLKQYIQSFGTPIEAFTQLFGSNPVLRAISQMNPILKTPIEIGIGKDSFRQKDLQDVYDAREYKLAPQIIKDLLQIKEGKKDILKKNKQGKLEKVGERTVYVADPVRLLIARSLFTSRGVSYLDQVFGNDLQGFVKFLKTTTGLKPQTVDLEAQKGIKERNQKRQLEDLLTKTGQVRKFERVYTPKR